MDESNKMSVCDSPCESTVGSSARACAFEAYQGVGDNSGTPYRESRAMMLVSIPVEPLEKQTFHIMFSAHFH